MILKNITRFLIGILTTASCAYASPIIDASDYTVRVKSTTQYAFVEDEAGTGNGAGFLIDKERGWILTNAHVSGYGNSEIETSFKGEEYVSAKPVYIDTELDLAVLAIEVENIPSRAKEAQLECGDKPLNGLPVAAFGHPHGLSYSSSRGIISQIRYYHGADWVQTDAAINPGNSGGPLIELSTGKIVGINAMGLEETQGLNFAVPMKPICKIVSLLKEGKNPSPPKLPFNFATNESSEEYLIVAPGMSGEIPNGFKMGDRIVAVDGIKVSTPTELKNALRGNFVDTSLTVQRDEEEINVSVAVMPQDNILERSYVIADGALISKDVYPERWALEGYYHVQSVSLGSYAEQQGWERWKLIISIDGVRPKSLAHIAALLKGEESKVIIFRGWSEQDTKMHDYHELRYWPWEVELVKKGH